MKPQPVRSENGLAIEASLGSLRKTGPDSAAEARLRGRMRRDWRALDTSPSRRGPVAGVLFASPWRVAAILGVAAGAAALVVTLAVLTAPRSVYAQVLAGVREARSVYAVGSQYQNGEATDTIQVWYDAARGVREEQASNGATRIRVDNGEFEWIYRAAADTVIKGLSRDPVGEIEEALHPLRVIDDLDAKRVADLDAALDGRPGRAWAADMSGTPSAMRWVIWLDERDRLLRYEEHLRGGDGFILDERVDLWYDVEIPDERFAADFSADPRVIDRTAESDAFKLEDAVATAERLGIIVAIHEVRRVDDDTVFVMSTSRPSPQVIDRLGPIHSERDGQAKVYGTFEWYTNGRRLPDHRWLDGMNPDEVASWRMDGVDYQWVLIRDAKDWIDEEGHLPVGFNVYTRGEWQRALKAADQPWMLWNEQDVMTLQVPEKAEGLSAVLSDTYAQTLVMGDATGWGSPRLKLRARPLTPQEVEEHLAAGTPEEEVKGLSVRPTAQPQDITFEAWRTQVQAYLADLDALNARPAE